MCSSTPSTPSNSGVFSTISFRKKRESRKWLVLIYNNHSILYQLLMTTISKTRIRIFDQWQIKESSLESQPPKRNSTEPSFGQDLILETQRLISNVNEFLVSKKGYKKSIQQAKELVKDLLDKLHQECNYEAEESSLAEANLLLYRTDLCKLYLCLRNAKHLQRCLTHYFQTANLANYDRQVTQLSFTEIAQVMQNRLEQAVKVLQGGMHRLMQAQKLKQSGKELSSIFGKEYTPAYALQRLQELMAHDNIVKIHFLMIFQLEELQATADEFARFLNVSQSEYLKHELVLDSIGLMSAQTKQMQNQLDQAKQELENACAHPSKADPRILASNQEKRQQAWQRNTRIYQTNLQNFTRVNVETSMFYFTELKGKFVEQLDRFAQGTTSYCNNHASLLFLLDRHALLTDIQSRLALVGKVSEPDRRLALTIYNETSLHLLPEDSGGLGELKQGLLQKMELLMVNNRIAYNKRARKQVSLQHDTLHHQTIIRQIEDAPLSQQYALTSTSLSTINTSIFELDKILGDINKQSDLSLQKKEKVSAIRSYLLALHYAGAMGRRQDFEEKLEEFQRIGANEGYQDLPVRFQAILLNYINDIQIIKDSRELTGSLQNDIQEAANHLAEKLSKSHLSNIDGQLEKELQKLREVWFILHHRYLRRVSAYGEELVMDRLQQVCLAMASRVKARLKEEKKLVDQKKMDVDRKLFFSHRILNELVQLATDCPLNTRDSLKIVNINHTLQEVFRLLDNGFISKPIGGKLSDIIKLSLLEQYLYLVQGRGNLWRAVRTLRHIGYLQSVSQLYPSSTESREAVLQALLRIQFQMNELALILKVQDQHRAFLNERVPPLIKEMRKFPLTLAAKHDVSGFQALWRYSEIINELRRYVPSRYSALNIIKVASIFVGVGQLKDARKAAEGNYDAYENAIVKEKKSIEEYFGRTATAFRVKVQAISRELELVTKAFLNRDKSMSLYRAVESLCKKAQ